MNTENPFHVKLGRIYAPGGTGRFVSFAGRVRRAANKTARSRRGGRANSRNVEQYFARRVIVKVNLVKMEGMGIKAQRLHLKYIERDSAAMEGERGELFGHDNTRVEPEDFWERGKDDPHQFRLVVSPEDGKDMGDLTGYTRNLMNQMEKDLGTKLDWVAANHYDTANPHAHIVIRGVRDDGKTLIIPRAYISHGMRERAEDQVTRELGPLNQIDVAKKLARQVQQERFTTLDRDLVSMMDRNIVDFSGSPKRGEEWERRLQKWRVKELSRMGLAEKVGIGRWRIENTFERTLRRLGERGDIIKAYHRALKAASIERMSRGDVMYDPMGERASDITGKVISKGVLDDVNDRSFVVIDTLDGQAVFVETGREANIADIEKDMVITVGPRVYAPKPSDHTIADIASSRGGIYSPAAHMLSDPSASENYIKAHVRRLEAMRRKGHVTRREDGSWEVPKDYLKQAADYEKVMSLGSPIRIEVMSRMPIEKLPKAVGKTWLDTSLIPGEPVSAHGFGEDVEKAKAARKEFLVAQKFIGRDGLVTEATLRELEQKDLASLGETLSEKFGKPYAPAPESGRVTGTYLEAIDRPSGRYALIEKSKEFTLVPWRETLERNLGRSVTGSISSQSISWALTKGRAKGMGQSIS